MGIFSFHKKYYFLSMEYPCNIQVDGLTYPNLKRAYAAVRFLSHTYKHYCLTCSDKELNYIINNMTEGPLIKEDFIKNKLEPLIELHHIKFKEDELKQQLLATGEEQLIYINRMEPVLGKYKDKGENLLGIALSSVRLDLQNGI